MWGRWVLVAAAGAAGVRLTSLTSPLSSDEAGLLLVAGQWGEGRSLYGDHWVDRPPLLVAAHGLADVLGGAVALRLLGVVAGVTTVLLAAALGRRLGGPAAEAWTAGAAAAYTSMPLFDARAVTAELLAAPCVLAGVLAMTRDHAGPLRTAAHYAGAGACGVAALLLKQSVLDVFAFALGFVAATGVRDGWPLRAWVGRVAALACGSAAVLIPVVTLAVALGSSPSSLWEAVVAFRLEASALIADAASPATAGRFWRLPGLFVLTGAAVLVGALVAHLSRRRRGDPVAVGTAMMVAWEILTVLAGGSYWLHYLMALVPGLVLVVSATAGGMDLPSAVSRVTVAWAGTLAVGIALVLVVVPPPLTPSQAAGRWFADQRLPDDTAVVAYGKADLLGEAGATSPYRFLWSLPVRVRDPELRRLAGVLSGPRAPEWLFVRAWDSWAIDPDAARRVAERRYRVVAVICGYDVYLRDGVRRPVGPPPRACS